MDNGWMGIEIFETWNVFCLLNYFHKVFIFAIKSSKLNSIDSGAICSSELSTCVLTGAYAYCTPEVAVFLSNCLSCSSTNEIPKKKE